MKIKINDLYVGYIYDVFNVENGVIIINECLPSTGPCILKKESDSIFVNLDNDKAYTTKNCFGLNRVEKGTLKPLSLYYGMLNIKRRPYRDSADVHRKVKTLRKTGRIR